MLLGEKAFAALQLKTDSRHLHLRLTFSHIEQLVEGHSAGLIAVLEPHHQPLGHKHTLDSLGHHPGQQLEAITPG